MPEHAATGHAMTLPEFRQRWETKPVLRLIYQDFFDRIFAACKPGRTLEVGGGVGNFAATSEDIITIDIQQAAWLDVAADAAYLPFGDGTFTNIVLLDILHHIEFPSLFFQEASRVLTPGGRVVMLEPAITPVSWLFYRYFHPEDVDLQADPYFVGQPESQRDPYSANQAIPTLMFLRGKDRFERKHPELRIIKVELMSLIAYPLSGGFRRWSLIPHSLVEPLLRIERSCVPLFGKLMAFRLFVVLERQRC